jgi:hypothetical protein
MTDTPGDDAAATQDADSTAASGDGASNLPGVTADEVDALEEKATTGSAGADTREVGLGDGDDVEPGAGAVEPPD